MKKKKLLFLGAIITALLFATPTMTGMFTEDSYADDPSACGSGLTWSLNDDTNVLTITKSSDGTGVMSNYDYPFGSQHPWSNSIASVIIEEGVTTIGNYAFYNCNNLASVTIPSGVKTIGFNAFYGCYNLASVTIPSGVKTIGECAFFHCTSLISITIPGSVETIDNYAFKECFKLETVVMQDGIKTINEKAFADCVKLKYITIPNSMTSIHSTAFYSSCSEPTSVTVTLGDTELGYKLLNGSFGSSWILPGQTSETVETITIDLNGSIDTKITPTEGKNLHISTNATVNNDPTGYEPQVLNRGEYVGNNLLFIRPSANVTFNPNGGTPTPDVQTVSIGSLISEPESVTKIGYEFNGWYLDNIMWDFDTPVNSDMILMAHWTVLSPNENIANNTVDADTVDADTVFVLSAFATVIALVGIAFVIVKR